MDSIDCIVVAHNHAEPLRTLLHRLVGLTVHPCRVIVVDHASTPAVRLMLVDFAARHSNATVVLNGGNYYCAHGTNVALSLTTAPWIFYFCSKEAFPMFEGWEVPCVEYMRKDPRVALAGTLTRVPEYATGAGYARMSFFKFFRNKTFALEHPTRAFSHVQGGFWVLRREAFTRTGYFNERVYHRYMDVEYSYVLESNGWRLGDIPEVRVRYQRMFGDDECEPDVAVYHPLTIGQLARCDARRRTAEHVDATGAVLPR